LTAATLIVVPTYNEAENIARLVAAVRASFPTAHLLVVDDASPDGTAAIVKRLTAQDDQVHLLERPGKLGLGSAYVAGFGWGLERGYQRFFEMDADFSHDPQDLPAFEAALDAGADVVVGSRGVPGGGIRGWGPLRYALSKGGSLYSRLVLGVGLRDLTTGFKAYSRRALEQIDVATLRSNGYAFQIETSYRALRQQLRVVEIPIVFVDRRVGKSKMTFQEVWGGVAGVWLMRGRGKRNTP
jgi:dolichol-phosphate mannosyltransferase